MTIREATIEALKRCGIDYAEIIQRLDFADCMVNTAKVDREIPKDYEELMIKTIMDGITYASTHEEEIDKKCRKAFMELYGGN